MRKQALDGINIEDIIALFRPCAQVCEVEVIVNKKVYEPKTITKEIPLRQEKAKIVTETKHFAVNLNHGVPYKK